MDKLIRLDDAIRSVEANQFLDYFEKTHVLAILKKLPAVDSTGIVQDRWKQAIDNSTHMHECSVCGARVVKGLYEHENPNLFCYHCGARMNEFNNTPREG